MDAMKKDEDRPEDTLPYCGCVGALRDLLAGLPYNMPVNVLAYGDVADGDPDDLQVLDGRLAPLLRFCVHEGAVILLVDEVDWEDVTDPLDMGAESGPAEDH